MPLIFLNASQRLDSNLPVLDDDEKIVHQQNDTEIFFASRPSEGLGTLFLTTKHAIWLHNTNRDKGVSIDFPFIIMHAISRDSAAFPFPCIYCQLDEPVGGGGAGDDDEEDATASELRFVPKDPAAVDALYKVFCHCAMLNPDQGDDDDEDQGDFFFNEDEVAQSLRISDPQDDILVLHGRPITVHYPGDDDVPAEDEDVQPADARPDPNMEVDGQYEDAETEDAGGDVDEDRTNDL